MDTLQFIASLVHAVAWPTAVLGTALIFRRQLRDLISGALLRRFKAGPLEFEFDRVISSVETQIDFEPAARLDLGLGAVARLRGRRGPIVNTGSASEDLADLARASPRTAVLHAYTRLEDFLRQTVIDAGRPSEGPAGMLARRLHAAGMISAETVSAVEGIAFLRNLIAHDPNAQVSQDRALNYLDLVDGVMWTLRQPPPEPPVE